MRTFQEVYDTACLHKGGPEAVESRLPDYLETEALCSASDSVYLSAMSLRIFRAGLKHSMVDAKWPAFEKTFNGFDPHFCAHLNDEFIESCMSNAELIRHFGKLKTIRANAYLVLTKAEEHGGFGAYLAEWPTTNIVGLWIELKKQGAHLGGSSAASFLRMVGKDTFMLTSDVVTVLVNEGVVSKTPSSQKDLKLVQQTFNEWQQESGRPLCEISRIVSLSVS